MFTLDTVLAHLYYYFPYDVMFLVCNDASLTTFSFTLFFLDVDKMNTSKILFPIVPLLIIMIFDIKYQVCMFFLFSGILYHYTLSICISQSIYKIFTMELFTNGTQYHG